MVAFRGLLGRVPSKRLAPLGIFFWITTSPGLARAQDYVGELLVAGGERLRFVALDGTVRGKTLRWETPEGWQEWSCREDGTLHGTVRAIAGFNSATGKWWVSRGGNLCFEYAWTMGAFPPARACRNIYRMHDKVFLAGRVQGVSESPHGQRLIPLTIGQ